MNQFIKIYWTSKQEKGHSRNVLDYNLSFLVCKAAVAIQCGGKNREVAICDAV